MKKVLILFLTTFLIFPSWPAHGANISLPNLNTRYILVMDCESGRVLFERNGRKVVPMASTTKIMTALIAIEKTNLNDIVTVSKRASSIHGSTLGLKYGQKVTMEELLYGLMLKSGNDCAIAVAEHISGSVEKFVEMMNSKAFDIGAFDTHFSTPHGLDGDGHFTSAYDLALITRYAFNIPLFSKIVSSKEVTLNGAGGERSLRNINKLLWMMDGADGVKTGFTGKAGKCLVSSASRGSRRIICVTLDSQDRWDDSKVLIEYGFKKYSNDLKIQNSDYSCSIPVINGRQSYVKAGLEGVFTIPISDEERDNLLFEKYIPDKLEAPIYKNQQIGRLVLSCKDKEIFSIPYKAMEDVEPSKAKSLIDKLLSYLNIKSND